MTGETSSGDRTCGPSRREPGRRRSRAIRLTIIGGAGGLATLLGGCSSSSGSWHRNVYRSIEDCAADYSRSHCFAQGTQRGDRYLGPAYRMVGGRWSSCTSSDRGPGPWTASRKVAVEDVTRGGFGTSCPSRGRSWGSGGRAWGYGG